MVVHRKDFKKQNVKIEKVCFFYERQFLQKKILEIASLGLHTKDMKK